jgi:hypothetical protein
LRLNLHVGVSNASRSSLSYYPRVSVDLWIGAVTTLAGAVIGGAISFALSRQQMKDAHDQREEEFEREKQRRSADRRFDAYADFLTKARAFRNAIRGYGDKPGSTLTPETINAIAGSASSASSLVFLVVESAKTYDACRAVVRAMDRTQSFLPQFGPNATDDPWLELNHDMARLVREFQAAAREELEISGVNRSQILKRDS